MRVPITFKWKRGGVGAEVGRSDLKTLFFSQKEKILKAFMAMILFRVFL